MPSGARWKEETTMAKQLTIGQDYGSIFGLPSGNKMIFMGGNKWRAESADGRVHEADSAKTTENALEYVNRPSVSVGK